MSDTPTPVLKRMLREHQAKLDKAMEQAKTCYWAGIDDTFEDSLLEVRMEALAVGMLLSDIAERGDRHAH